jgi:hypothetical protein
MQRGGVLIGKLTNKKRELASNASNNDIYRRITRPSKPFTDWSDQELSSFIDEYSAASTGDITESEIGTKPGTDIISGEPMNDPNKRVTFLENDHFFTYDSESLHTWLKHSQTNPSTRRKISRKVLRHYGINIMTNFKDDLQSLLNDDLPNFNITNIHTWRSSNSTFTTMDILFDGENLPEHTYSIVIIESPDSENFPYTLYLKRGTSLNQFMPNQIGPVGPFDLFEGYDNRNDLLQGLSDYISFNF